MEHAPLLAQVCLMALDVRSRQFAGAELALGGQFTDRLFNGEVA